MITSSTVATLNTHSTKSQSLREKRRKWSISCDTMRLDLITWNQYQCLPFLLQDVTRCFIVVRFLQNKFFCLKSFIQNRYFCSCKCVLSTEKVNIEEKLKVNYISFRKVNDVSCCFYRTELLMKFYYGFFFLHILKYGIRYFSFFALL